MSRKIVISKVDNKKGRTMVELDNDVHCKVSEIAFRTNRSIRDVASILIRDALQYVEIDEPKGKHTVIPPSEYLNSEQLKSAMDLLQEGEQR